MKSAPGREKGAAPDKPEVLGGLDHSVLAAKMLVKNIDAAADTQLGCPELPPGLPERTAEGEQRPGQEGAPWAPALAK